MPPIADPPIATTTTATSATKGFGSHRANATASDPAHARSTKLTTMSPMLAASIAPKWSVRNLPLANVAATNTIWTTNAIHTDPRCPTTRVVEVAGSESKSSSVPSRLARNAARFIATNVIPANGRLNTGSRDSQYRQEFCAPMLSEAHTKPKITRIAIDMNIPTMNTSLRNN